MVYKLFQEYCHNILFGYLTYNVYVQEPLTMTLASKHVAINYQSDFVSYLYCAATDLVNMHKAHLFHYPDHIVIA
jgi:general stress protein CsbA